MPWWWEWKPKIFRLSREGQCFEQCHFQDKTHCYLDSPAVCPGRFYEVIYLANKFLNERDAAIKERDDLKEAITSQCKECTYNDDVCCLMLGCSLRRFRLWVKI